MQLKERFSMGYRVLTGAMLALVWLLHGVTHAQTAPKPPANFPAAYLSVGQGSVSEPLINEITGSYSYYKRIRVDGEEDRSSQIVLDIARVSSTVLFAQLSVPFRNALMCEYRGVFEYKTDGEFIAIDDIKDPNSCVMQLKVNSNSLVLIDESIDHKRCTVKARCYPDGSVDRLYFSRHIKEKVTSLSSILVSDEYKAEKDRFRAQFNR